MFGTDVANVKGGIQSVRISSAVTTRLPARKMLGVLLGGYSWLVRRLREIVRRSPV